MSNYYDHSLARLMEDFVPFEDEVCFEFRPSDDHGERIAQQNLASNGSFRAFVLA
ncbi:MAG: hypothetical protein ACO3O3_12375 [Ilumatobacteraceae bacterium]